MSYYDHIQNVPERINYPAGTLLRAYEQARELTVDGGASNRIKARDICDHAIGVLAVETLNKVDELSVVDGQTLKRWKLRFWEHLEHNDLLL